MPTLVRVESDPDNGLAKIGWAMTIKITTAPKEMLQTKIGSLNSQTLDAINIQLAVVLNLDIRQPH